MLISPCILILLLFSCQSPSDSDQQSLSDTESHAMVVSASPDASEVGIDVLRNGGNAIDAAVAVHFTLAVTYPVAGNIGGGGFMVYRSADGDVTSLDFREEAPGLAHRDMYLDEDDVVIEGLSLDGPLSVGVPGSVAGLYEAHVRFGNLPWKDLISYAVDLAANGYEITATNAKYLNTYRDELEKWNPQGCALLEKQVWETGDILKQPDLANTLQLIAEQGPGAFYNGAIGDSLVAFMQSNGGLISHDDLKNYDAVWREPIKGQYDEYTIWSMPPPSSGGICLLQMLEMIEPFGIEDIEFHSTEAVHLMVEAERRAYADRSEYLGDPDFWDVPIEMLLDSFYLAERMSDFDPQLAGNSDSIRPGVMPLAESEQTTHFSIVDEEGNAVALTTTLNSAYGSKMIVPGLGFVLNNQMDDFSIAPGYPNQFGLVGDEANAIEPGKRMLSSMTPTIVEKNGELFMVIGTPGGSTIITSVFQNYLNVVEFGIGMQESVDQGRFHHQWLPDMIQIEEGALPDTVISELEAMGHEVMVRSSIGRVDAILIMPNGSLEGGADPRGDDAVGDY